jgi:predicted N-acetyltransferase YhbS
LINPELTIRPAASSEADAIDRLVEAAMAEYSATHPVMHAGYLRYSLDREHAAGAEQLVAELDGRIVGAVLYDARVRNRPGWPSDYATFGTLVADPTIRRRRIGASLVAACIERARESGAAGVLIETMPFMQAGEALYGPFGFRRWAAGDWDGTPLVRRLLGRDDVPETTLSAWRLEFD